MTTSGPVRRGTTVALNFNPNISSIDTRNSISKFQERIKSSYSKLASGRRIVSAKDDAAGLAIGTRMNAQMVSLGQSMRSASDGISMLRTAEGAQSQISDNLTRMKELSVQAANGTLSDADRASIQQEIDGLKAEIDRISEGTEFNDQALLDGSYETTIDVGNEEGIDVTIEDTGTESLSVDSVDVSTSQGAHDAIESIDAAIDQVSAMRASLGAMENRITSSLENMRTEYKNTAEAHSRIMDTDVAEETANLTRFQLLQQSSVNMLANMNRISPMSVHSLL